MLKLVNELQRAGQQVVMDLEIHPDDAIDLKMSEGMAECRNARAPRGKQRVASVKPLHGDRLRTEGLYPREDRALAYFSAGCI